MKTMKLAIALMAFAGTACNTLEKNAQPVDSVDTRQPAYSTAQHHALYNTLVAEFALKNELNDLAYSYYQKAVDNIDDPQLHQQSITIARRMQQWHKVEAASARWLDIEPGNIDAKRYLLMAYLHLGHTSKAYQQSLAIIRTAGDRADLGMTIVHDLLRQASDRHITQSIALKLTQDYPDNAGAQFNLARISLQAGDRETAKLALDRTLNLQPQLIEAILLRIQILYNSGQLALAFDSMASAIADNPNNVTLYVGYSKMLTETGRQSEALQSISATYQLASNNPHVVVSLADMAIKLNQFTTAKAYLNKVLALGGRDMDAHYYLAQIAEYQRNNETAIRHYAKIQSGNKQLDAQTRIAQLLGSMGHIEQARQHLEYLRQLNPSKTHQIHFSLVEVAVLQQAGQRQQAYEFIADALNTYPDNVEILYASALAAESIGKDTVFEQQIRTLLQLQPDHALGLNALGYFLADRTHQLDEAEYYIRKALSLLPDNAAIIDSMGWINYRLGHHEEALALLQKAYTLALDPEIAAHLGEVLWAMGDTEKATQIWRDALTRDPQSPVLLKTVEQFIE